MVKGRSGIRDPSVPDETSDDGASWISLGILVLKQCAFFLTYLSTHWDLENLGRTIKDRTTPVFLVNTKDDGATIGLR